MCDTIGLALTLVIWVAVAFASKNATAIVDAVEAATTSIVRG